MAVPALAFTTLAGPISAQVTRHEPVSFEPCVHERVGMLFSTAFASRSASNDDAAPTIAAARFLRDGRVAYTDFGLKNVGVLDGESLETLLVMGREGRGPGEFASPVDIAEGPNGHLFVADDRRNAISVFSPDGSFVREYRTGQSPYSLVVDDDGTVFYSRRIPAAFLARGLPLPVLFRLDPSTGDETALLTATQDWLGRAPTYNAPLGFPMLRMGLDNQLYVGFRQSAVVMRVDKAGAGAETVAEGCIPANLRDEYTRKYAPGERGRRTATLLTDFVVFADGRLVVQGGLSTGSGGRVLDLYAPDGEWAHSILLEPGANYTAWGVINPWSPTAAFFWSPASGESKLLKFDPPQPDRFPMAGGAGKVQGR